MKTVAAGAVGAAAAVVVAPGAGVAVAGTNPCVKCHQREAVTVYCGASICAECLEKRKRLQAFERQMGQAIASQYVLAFIVLSVLLGIGFYFIGWNALVIAAAVAAIIGVGALWAVNRRGQDGRLPTAGTGRGGQRHG